MSLTFLRAHFDLARQVDQLHRDVRRLSYERDDAYALIRDLRDDVAVTVIEAAAWRRRAEVLFDIADPDLRDGVLGVIDTIERMPQIEEAG